MKRALKWTLLVVAVVILAAQLIRPSRANPPTDPSRTIAAQLGKSSAVVAVLDRSCNECHSNSTVWPGYTEVAPLSWIAVRAIDEARQAVNFSEWANYSPEQQRQLLALSCAEASSGRMPGSVSMSLKLAAPLSQADVAAICAASRSNDQINKEARQ